MDGFLYEFLVANRENLIKIILIKKIGSKEKNPRKKLPDNGWLSIT